MTPTQHAQVKVWFDGSCPLCTREIAFMRKLDKAKAIAFIDILKEGSVCPLEPAQLLSRLHAEENGKLQSGAAAFAAMWRAIPVLRPLGLAARNPHVLFALERVYLVFLRHRPRLQRWMLWFEAKKI
jgi:predicted DCC family thiol-disulfide oxidoreductase YuxK